LRIYELCLIIHSDTTEELQDQMLQSIGEIIAQHSGSVLKTEKWGKKNFKYVIKKQSKGYYCFLVFESATAGLKEIERSIMYNEAILRYNFIRLENFVAPPVPVVTATETATETAPETEAEAKAKDGADTETVVAEQASKTEE
jgi:small subunit ribosomal protein S6